MRTKAIFLDKDEVINKPIIKKGKLFMPKPFKNFKIHEHMGQLGKHHKLIQRIERVLFN